MEDKNIEKLFHLCKHLKDFCLSHSECSFCPFKRGNGGCLFTDDTGLMPENYWKLFPEDLVNEEEE